MAITRSLCFILISHISLSPNASQEPPSTISCCNENTCKFEDSAGSGNHLDLSAFSCHTLEYIKQDYHFLFTPCANKDTCNYNDNVIRAMMIQSNNDFCAKIAEWDDGDIQPKYEATNNEWIFDYNNGDDCFGAPRTFTAVWRCNRNEPLVRIIDADEPVKCHYVMILETQYACGKSYSKPECEMMNNNGKLSVGWIFVIIFIVCVVSYCVFGYILTYKCKNEENGLMDVRGNMPHLYFWAALPRYVWEGCKVTYAYILFAIGKSGMDVVMPPKDVAYNDNDDYF